MEVTRGNGMAHACFSRAGLGPVAAALAWVAVGCGGRAVPGPVDSGERDGGQDASEDAAACDDSICDLRHPDCCGRCLESVAQCPSIAPFCCGEGRNCYREPVEYPEQSDDLCYEKPLEGSVIPGGCTGEDLNPELCPADHPYCCSWGVGDACVDHPLVGYLCQPEEAPDS
jgi:hypothetical protein